MNRRLLPLAAAGLAVAGLAAVSHASAPSPQAAQTVNQATALIDAAPSGSATYASTAARNVADIRGAGIPLPPGGNFNGVQWEAVGGGIAAAAMDGTMGYNAACQWLRAWHDGRDASTALQVLSEVPSWTVFRGSESGAFLAKVSAEAAGGGGEDVTGMLRDCDATHAREVAYAAKLGLVPSS
jgi:hypothetical protein